MEQQLTEWLDRIAGGPEPPGISAEEGVSYWQQRVLRVAIVVGLVLGAISLVPGLTRAAAEGNYILLVANIVVYLVAVGVLLARHVAFRIRAGLLVFAVFSIGLVQVITSGIHAAGAIWLFTGVVAAAIFFDLRAALALMAVTAATLFAQLGLARMGRLPAELVVGVGSPRWIEMATDLILLATVVSLFMAVLLEGLRSSFDRLRRVSNDLEAERNRLFETNRELEREMARRRQAEEKSAWLATAMEQAAEAVAITELDGSIRYVNKSFVRLFGGSRADLEGTEIDHAGMFDDPGAVERILDELDHGGVWSGRLTAHREGMPWQAQVSFSTLLDQDGRPVNRLAVIRDVSREEELEDQLQQAHKLQAMGTFAGGIAHDFNNLLVPILGTAELLSSGVEGEVKEQLKEIARSAQRGKALVSQILAFSRGGKRQPDTARFASVLEDSKRMLRASLAADIKLDYAIQHEGPVHISDAEAQQILMNLCTNAAHAMREGAGTLRITVDNVPGREVDTRSAVAASPPVAEEEYVRLTVADTGEGMTQETLDRVFEPFFTTKPSGEGTGLGLAMVQGVVSGAGGTMVIRSSRGEGTTVEVLLPEGTEVADTDDRAPSQHRGNGQRVLVVDDEEPVRAVVGRFLERLGYRPQLAAPDEAERIIESEAPIDLLITDLSMPGLNGIDLGRMAHRLRPQLPMVLCTGLADEDTVGRAQQAGFDSVLAKPFEQADISDVLSSVLAESTGA